MDVSNRNNQRTFMEIQGTIVAIEPIRTGMNRGQNCGAMIMLEDMDGNNVNFTVGPMTYVLDFATLQEGMQVGVFYRTDAPAPLIFPPQYQASVIVPDRMGVNVDVGYYNSMLVNENQTLQLNLSGDVPVLTSNNQMYLGNPANHELVVVYSMSTRSIPAQTTPDKVIVLCGNMTGNQGNMGNQNDQNGGWTPGGNQNSGWFPGNGNQNGNWTPGGNWMPCSQCQQGNQGISGTPRNGSNRQSMMDMPGMNLR